MYVYIYIYMYTYMYVYVCIGCAGMGVGGPYCHHDAIHTYIYIYMHCVHLCDDEFNSLDCILFLCDVVFQEVLCGTRSNMSGTVSTSGTEASDNLRPLHQPLLDSRRGNTYRNIDLFLQKSSKVSGNLREFTGECNLGILYSSSLLAKASDHLLLLHQPSLDCRRGLPRRRRPNPKP